MGLSQDAKLPTPFYFERVTREIFDKKKNLYVTFKGTEKVFDWAPRVVLWWALMKLHVEKCLAKMAYSMYRNARSRLRVNYTFSDEELYREIRSGYPVELLYVDDLALMSQLTA